MLLGGRSGDVSSMPWGIRRTLASWANSSVGIQSCPTSPRRPAVRPDPTRPWYVRVSDSTGSVDIGFRLFVLLGRLSGYVSSMLWGVRGTLVSWAYCSAGVPSCPALPRRPAVRPDPTRPWYVRVMDSTGRRRPTGQQQGKKGGRRLADKPRMNRLSTAHCVPPSVYMGFGLSVLPPGHSRQLFSIPCLGGKEDGCLLGGLTRRRPVLPNLAPPRRTAVHRPAPTHPRYIHVLDSTKCVFLDLIHYEFARGY